MAESAPPIKENTGNSPAAEHNSFGNVAIRLGYITETQLEEAMKAQANAAKAGLRKRLGEILIKKGFLTPEQFQEVLKSQTVKSKRIGSYELISKLGEGGMGAVFKARQVFLDRVIALKILSPKMAKNKDSRDRFVREARAVAKLNHPNIVAGIDVGTADGYCYFAMEFVDGESLGEYMHHKGGKLVESVALEFVRQAAMALHHAHQNNLLHRDVKPDNLLLDKVHNIVKLADLGLARSVESAEDDKQLTQAGQAVGTPFYISPEQARGLSDLLPATDLYSLGASLFHFLTGQVPFDGTTAAVIMTRHLTDPVPDLRKINPKISESAAKIVLRCMEKKPENRYISATELIADIERVQRGEPLESDVVRKPKGSVRTQDAERVPEKKKILSFRDEEDEEDNESPREHAKRTTKAPMVGSSQTSNRVSLRRKRRSSSTGGLVVLLVLVCIAAAAIFFKPEWFKSSPVRSTKSKDSGLSGPRDPNTPDVSGPFQGIPARLSRALDGTLAYSIDFESDVSACDTDATMQKTGEGLELLADGAKDETKKNHVVRLARLNSKNEQNAGAMLRLILPADLQLTPKARVKFKICVSKASEAEPIIQIHWLHEIEGTGMRLLGISSIKTKAKDAWVEVSLMVSKVQKGSKVDNRAGTPQSISIFAARPDDGSSVFIDDLELIDGALTLAGRSATPPATPATPDAESPIVPPPAH